MHKLFKLPCFLGKHVEYCTGCLFASLLFRRHLNFLRHLYTPVHFTCYIPIEISGYSYPPSSTLTEFNVICVREFQRSWKKNSLMLLKFVVFQHSYILFILFLCEIQKSGLEFVYVVYKRGASKELEELRTVKFIHTAWQPFPRIS